MYVKCWIVFQVNDPALDGKIAEIILRNAVREFPGLQNFCFCWCLHAAFMLVCFKKKNTYSKQSLTYSPRSIRGVFILENFVVLNFHICNM